MRINELRQRIADLAQEINNLGLGSNYEKSLRRRTIDACTDTMRVFQHELNRRNGITGTVIVNGRSLEVAPMPAVWPQDDEPGRPDEWVYVPNSEGFRETVIDIPINPIYTGINGWVGLRNDLDGLPYEADEAEAEAVPDETEPVF